MEMRARGEIGDLAVVFQSGAYGAARAPGFLGHPAQWKCWVIDAATLAEFLRASFPQSRCTVESVDDEGRLDGSPGRRRPSCGRAAPSSGTGDDGLG